jgi:outer membrane protein TolC
MNGIVPLLTVFATGLNAAPLSLNLKRAVEMATSPEGNAAVQLSTEALKQARARSAQARAALLPNVEGAFSLQDATRNLAAVGINLAIPIPGVHLSTFVGPFTTIDARVSASQSVLDFGSIRRYQASKSGVSAASSDLENVDEQVAANVARAYLAAVRADADVEAAQANVTLAGAVVKQAENQKEAGTGTGIEITRARVQLANDEQHLLDAENGRRNAHLRLLRVVGLRLDTELQLTDALRYAPADSMTFDEAKALALKTRPDYRAQQEREATARLSSSAVKLERLPTVAAFGDYGASGTGFDNSLPTRTAGVSVRVPLFDGGRRDARRAEAASQFRAEQVRSSDMKEQIDLDIRLALDDLRSADAQVKVANEGLQLSENELNQARRRYDAGVANSLEVTDAQTRLERARDNRTTALYKYNLARVALAQATGTIRSFLQ